MKKTIVCAVAMAGLTAFADASRAVVTMVDGSNVKGGSLIDKIEGDAIFGDDVSVPVELLKSIETVGTNGAAKLVFANGDAISLKLDTAAITIDSMLGRIEVPFKNIRKVVFSKSGGAKCGAGGSSVFIGKMPATLPESGMPMRAGTPLVETVNGITYRYFVVDGEAEISSGIRERPAISSATMGALEIPSTLGGNPVTSLGADAFYGCSGITSVKIPDSVANIGYCCFFGCGSLRGGLVIPDSVVNIEAQAFEHCRSLTSAKIGDNVPELKSWAFYDCPKLRSVEFGSGLKKIGDWSFDQDRSLVSVTIPAGVIRIGEGAFLLGAKFSIHCQNLSYCYWFPIAGKGYQKLPIPFVPEKRKIQLCMK